MTSACSKKRFLNDCRRSASPILMGRVSSLPDTDRLSSSQSLLAKCNSVPSVRHETNALIENLPVVITG